jgi:iron complex outermembrane receptor protein
MNARSARNLLALLALTASAGVAPLAVAQTAAAPDTTSDDTTLKLEKITVTGSYIPMAADAPSAPVAIINAAELAKTGTATNVLDMIRKAVPQFTGSSNIGSNNANISSRRPSCSSTVAAWLPRRSAVRAVSSSPTST